MRDDGIIEGCRGRREMRGGSECGVREGGRAGAGKVRGGNGNDGDGGCRNPLALRSVLVCILSCLFTFFFAVMISLARV